MTGVGVPFAGAAPAAATSDCIGFEPGSRESVAAVAVIVIGVVQDSPNAEQTIIQPEAYLKGSAERQAFTLRKSEVDAPAQQECPPATLTPGSRVLLALYEEDGRLAWPDALHTFVLVGGSAVDSLSDATLMPEDELIAQIRSITGQYVVPAEGEGTFSIQGSNIAILVVALLVVFGIGLALMRVWHRIDPT